MKTWELYLKLYFEGKEEPLNKYLKKKNQLEINHINTFLGNQKQNRKETQIKQKAEGKNRR